MCQAPSLTVHSQWPRTTQAAGCYEGVEAVAREFVRRDIVPEVAGRRGRGEQVSDEVAELPLRSGDVLTSMHECREFGAVILVGNELRSP